MTATMSRPMRSLPARSDRRWMTDERAFNILCFITIIFAFRDTMTGSLRYYLDMVHLGSLWFASDVICLFAFGWFGYDIVMRRKSPFGTVLFLGTIASTILGILFMNSSLFATISSFKMITPFFVGYCFAGRSMTDLPLMRKALLGLSIVAATGLILSPFFDFPWMGETISTFGQVRDVGKVIWSQGDLRYGGFAGENTAAAFTVVFPYFLIHRYLSREVNLLLWIPFAVALYNSNSKTTIGISVLFVIYYVVVEAVGRENFSIQAARRLARASFVLIAIPIVFILGLSQVDLYRINPLLFSLQDRIQHTWVYPFEVLSDKAPWAFVTGCGLGCFAYPMQATELANLWVPVDNYYILTYIMLGVPFLITVVGMVTATYKSEDQNKLLLIALLNVYAITVHSYGPSYCAVIIGYAFSDMFLKFPERFRRRRPQAVAERQAGVSGISGGAAAAL